MLRNTLEQLGLGDARGRCEWREGASWRVGHLGVADHDAALGALEHEDVVA